MFIFIRTRSGFALASSGFAFEGTTVFRCDIASEGIIVFRSEKVPLVARRGHNFIKLMLSSVCCNKLLALWNLVSSVFEVSFWAEALEPYTIYTILGTMSPLSTPVTDSISNLIDVYMWQDRFGLIQSRFGRPGSSEVPCNL